MIKLFGLFLILVFLGLLAFLIADIFYWFSISPKGYYEPLPFKESGFFDKVFRQFPIQFGKDLAGRDVNYFNAHCLIVFEGRQGSGKTISMVHYANLLKARFPECKVLSNTRLIFQDMTLENWQPLVTFNNGIYGVVACIDECQLWANNRLWKNRDSGSFSWDMIQEICQNRKHRRVILATTQNFSQLDKAIRLQTTEIRKCYTLFGCVTLVFCSVPDMDSEGNLVHKRFKRAYWFVQSDFLRSCYDTYATIEFLGKVGFSLDDK